MKAWETYLVEHYRPGASLDDLNSAVRDVRLAAASMARRSPSRTVRCVHCTIVPSDEALLALFEATSEQLVRDVYAHAGIPFERITGAVWLDAGEGMGRSTAAQTTDSLTSSKGAR
jgi:alkanesulfonate monooxygenase SsuD/methylene tetrahydromethanopterin reductase-like flavin-dependent oxidoreductase (luciferase family)